MNQHVSTTATTPDGVSVIVCTYNGASRIRPTLEALARCTANFPVEIILVDNNSNDGTAEIAQDIWQKMENPDFDFFVVHEALPGKAYALRAGVIAARGDLIVICDDDNSLTSNYLTLAIEIMRDPKIGAVGGQCEPIVDGEVPNFLYSHGWGYALGVQALASGDVTETRGFLWGAGLVLRRIDLLIFYNCPGFPTLEGRNTKLQSHEDSEVCAGLILLGRRLYYDQRLVLRHHVPSSRLTADYVTQLIAGFAAGAANLQYYRILRGLRARPLIKTIIQSGLRWLRWIGDNERKRGPRFTVLACLRVRFAMNENERRFYRIYRHLLAAVAKREKVQATTNNYKSILFSSTNAK